jgi:hypothetical protein
MANARKHRALVNKFIEQQKQLPMAAPRKVAAPIQEAKDNVKLNRMIRKEESAVERKFNVPGANNNF